MVVKGIRLRTPKSGRRSGFVAATQAWHRVPCRNGKKDGPQCRLRVEMICPQCRAEYRRGFTVCANCDVPLVESAELAARSVADVGTEDGESGGRVAGSPGDPNTDPFCSFWKGTDLRVCTEICTVLDETAIPHKMIRRQDHLFNWSNQAPYQIGVPASLYEKAELVIKEAFGTDEESGEDAVHSLPSPQEDPRSQKLRSVWVGDSDMECAGLCRELKDAGIYYRVDEQRELRTRGGTKNRYEIGVAEQDYGRAKEITGEIPLVQVEAEAEQDEEIPAVPEMGQAGSDWVGGGRALQEQEWYPEDATRLAWEGEPADSQHMIEMCLKENDIRMRWEMQDGKPQLFVLPEDEERATEIVREILQGQPPE